MTKITNRCASIGDLAMKICLTFIKNQTNFGRIQKDSEGTAAGIYACQRLQDNAFCPSSSQRARTKLHACCEYRCAWECGAQSCYGRLRCSRVQGLAPMRIGMSHTQHSDQDTDAHGFRMSCAWVSHEVRMGLEKRENKNDRNTNLMSRSFLFIEAPSSDQV